VTTPAQGAIPDSRPETSGSDTDHRELEKPEHSDALYQARGPEVHELAHRPLLTGDVLRLPDGQMVTLVQHPCAMANTRGRKQLTATVDLAPNSWLWRGSYRLMPLPALIPGTDYAVYFDDLVLVPHPDVAAAERVTILSDFGLNLLVQRWAHHNTRIVVWTKTIHQHTARAIEEADLVADTVGQLVASGWLPAEARTAMNTWLDERQPHSTLTYRAMLGDPQARSTVRAAARKHVRQLRPPDVTGDDT